MSATGNWVTINGVHVLIGATGKVEKGPKNLIGKTYDKALSTASGNRVPDPFTDTRTSNTVNVGNYSSLSSARADAKKVNKDAKEIKKEEKRQEHIQQHWDRYHEKVGIEFEYNEARMLGLEKKAEAIRAEANKRGLEIVETYRGSTVYTKEQAKGLETMTYKTRKIGEYQRRFNSATTPEAKEAIIKEAKGQGYYLSKNGYFSTRKPAPASINITMRGVKIDLSTATGRKDAKMLYGGLSEESKIKFQNFCLNKGLDPITLKPLQ